MGAHDLTFVYKTNDREEIKKKWKERVDRDGRESGTGGYAGNTATMRGEVQFKDLRLKTEDEARQHVLDNHEKWTGPIAVSFFLSAEPGKRDQARRQKAAMAFGKVQEKRYEVAKAIYTAFVERKAKLVGCPGCDSRLSREHLVKKLVKPAMREWPGRLDQPTPLPPKVFDLPSLPACPLCEAPLLSETDRGRLDAHNAKVEEAEKVYSEAVKPAASDTLAWCVGGWAAS